MSITNGQVLVATGFSTSDSADAPTVRGLIGVGTIAPWSASNAYALLDCASNGGVIYQCILARSATATVPASDGTHWTALTSSGAPTNSITVVVDPANLTVLASGTVVFYTTALVRTLPTSPSIGYYLDFQNTSTSAQIVNTGGSDVIKMTANNTTGTSSMGLNGYTSVRVIYASGGVWYTCFESGVSSGVVDNNS